MNLTTEDLQTILNTLGEVLAHRQKELDIAVDIADSDLTTAQEATNESIDALKQLVATKIRQNDIAIVQEGESYRGPGASVTMPQSIGCSC